MGLEARSERLGARQKWQTQRKQSLMAVVVATRLFLSTFDFVSLTLDIPIQCLRPQMDTLVLNYHTHFPEYLPLSLLLSFVCVGILTRIRDKVEN